MHSYSWARYAVIAKVALLLGGAAGVAYAGGVIVDDDASALFLAAHIASDSGVASENYDRYSRKLAKTLSLLSPAQQARVFGESTVGSGGGVGLPDTGGDGDGEIPPPDLEAGDGAGDSGTGEDSGEAAFDAQQVEEMREFQEFVLGDSSGWNGGSEPWWWALFRQIFDKWLERRSGGGGL